MVVVVKEEEEEAAGERRPCAHLWTNMLIENYSSDSGCLQTVCGTRFQTHLSLSVSCARVRAVPGSVRACAPLQRQLDRWTDSRCVARSLRYSSVQEHVCRGGSGTVRWPKRAGSPVLHVPCDTSPLKEYIIKALPVR